jgi:hypothetical protein
MRHLIATLLLCALSACVTSPVLAHDWYPYNCCSGHDCRPIEQSDVDATPDGFFIKESRETIAYSDPRIRKTPPEGDAKYHRCSVGGRPESETICLYIPNWGS